MKRSIYIWELLDGVELYIPSSPNAVKKRSLEEKKEKIARQLKKVEGLLKQLEPIKTIDVPTTLHVTFDDKISITVTDEEIVVNCPPDIYQRADKVGGFKVYNVLSMAKDVLKTKLKKIEELEKKYEPALTY